MLANVRKMVPTVDGQTLAFRACQFPARCTFDNTLAVSTELPASLSADVSTEFPASLSADVSTEFTASLSADVSTEFPASLSADAVLTVSRAMKFVPGL